MATKPEISQDAINEVLSRQYLTDFLKRPARLSHVFAMESGGYCLGAKALQAAFKSDKKIWFFGYDEIKVEGKISIDTYAVPRWFIKFQHKIPRSHLSGLELLELLEK